MIIRREEIQKITGLSWSTIIRMVLAEKFPVPVKLGDRGIGWRRSEVEEWVNGLEAKR